MPVVSRTARTNWRPVSAAVVAAGEMMAEAEGVGDGDGLELAVGEGVIGA